MRFKAQLVAKGYKQEFGVDFTEVFSPVAKLVSVRILIALATIHHWPLAQLDINNVFLHGYLMDEIYMVPPAGYTKASPRQVCRLVRSLYGLKQASQEWNLDFCHCLFAYGFRQSTSDHCLFTMGSGDHFLALLVYVDDVLITGPSDAAITTLKLHLDDVFTIKDLGSARYFLRMKIASGSSGTYLSLRKYVLELLSDVGLLSCKSASTPLPLGLHLAAHGSEFLVDHDSYHRLVSRLLYLNLTRPDLSYVV